VSRKVRAIASERPVLRAILNGDLVPPPRFRTELVQEARERLGLSRSELAELAGVTRERVWAWERGRDQPTASVVPPLARALGLSPMDLLDVDPDRPTFAALRIAAGVTLQDLAHRTGIPYTRVHRIERGTSSASAQDVAALSRVLEVPAKRLRVALAPHC
jgi:transcriptional regulator with XRE-family HTH domain